MTCTDELCSLVYCPFCKFIDKFFNVRIAPVLRLNPHENVISNIIKGHETANAPSSSKALDSVVCVTQDPSSKGFSVVDTTLKDIFYPFFVWCYHCVVRQLRKSQHNKFNSPWDVIVLIRP